jgi:thioesterase domain-containing protein
MDAKWGGMTHPAAFPPLLPFNLEPDEHFRRAWERAQQPLPHEDIPVTDLDLQVVASGYTVDGGPLRPWRQWCHKLSSSVAGTLHFEKLPRTGNPTSDQAT